MVTLLLISLLAIIPIGLIVILAEKTESSSLVVGGLFVIMAFFLYYSTIGPSNDDDRRVTSNQEYVQKKNLQKKDAIFKVKNPVVDKEKYILNNKKYDRIVKYSYIGLTAFLPAVVYLLFFIAFDDKKPEPLHALLFAVLVGCVVAVAAWGMGFSISDHIISINWDYEFAESINIGFLKIALPSEVLKWLALLVFLRLNKYYDEYIDGIVYSICLSMGFACILYVGFMGYLIDYSTLTFILVGIVTALILIPIYLMAGAIMGYFVALTKHRNKMLNYILSLVIPVLASGMLFSTLALIGDKWWYYLIFVIILPIITYIVYQQIWHLITLEKSRGFHKY